MSDLTVMAATRDILLPLGLTPQTTYTPVNVGDTGFTPTSLTGFNPGGVIDFYDSAGEESLTIREDWDGVSTPIPIDFDGMEYSGFQYAHAGGTVGTNITVGVPDNIEAMLEDGNPFLFVDIIEERDALPSGLLHEPIYQVYVEYRVSLNRPKTNQMEVNTWSLRQQKKARKDFRKVAVQIRSNPHLQNANGNNANDLSNPFNPNQPRVTILWRKKVVATPEAGIPQFVCALQFPVRGLREVISPDT